MSSARELSWARAIVEVLRTEGSSMHYSDITDSVVERGLRTSLGATPANTVNAVIHESIHRLGNESPFVKVGRGEFILREHFSEPADDVDSPQTDSTIELQEDATVVRAFGMYWRRDRVAWTSRPAILGVQSKGADAVDFCDQIGVYLLHDRRDIVYVGRASERPLGRRIQEHTFDRLEGRWDRFSWFGLRAVTSDGRLLVPPEGLIGPDAIITALEALLIEALEPPQNRRRGDTFKAIEYLQHEDPEVRRRRNAALLRDIERSLEDGS
ncbi:MAG: HTH domain-containing protein [bacterium]